MRRPYISFALSLLMLGAGSIALVRAQDAAGPAITERLGIERPGTEQPGNEQPGNDNTVEVEGGSLQLDSSSPPSAESVEGTAGATSAAAPPASAGMPANGDAAPAPKVVDDCARSPDKLGVARVVEIDTAHGPQFGNEHKGNDNFLNDGEVVLTFDDGPVRSHTRAVLDALAAECTRATFFMVGRMAVSDPAMVREVAKGGHTIGSHTWSHKNLASVAPARGRDELENGISAVTAANGAPIAPFFRFPFLNGNRAAEDYAATRDLAIFWVDIDSKDYTTRNPSLVISRVMAQLETKRKGIILMHDIQISTAKGIRDLLAELHKKGFKVVHVVPKASLTTIAAYDEAAKNWLASKNKGATPMAQRAVTWAANPPDPAVSAPRRPRVVHKRGAKPTAAPSAKPEADAQPSAREARQVVSTTRNQSKRQPTIFDF